MEQGEHLPPAVKNYSFIVVALSQALSCNATLLGERGPELDYEKLRMMMYSHVILYPWNGQVYLLSTCS